MSKSKRIRRQDPVRSGPIRSFAKLLAEQNSANGGRGKLNGNSSAHDSVPKGDPIADGVKRAYQVIDRYMAEGRRAAEQFVGAASATLGAAAASRSGNLQGLFEQMMRRQTELLPLWLELLGALGAVERPAVVSSDSDGNAQGAAKIAIEVSSRLPVQVEVDLKEHPPIEALAVAGLHPVNGEHPPVREVSFDSESGRNAVRIKVPDNQPPGVYAGVIVNQQSAHACRSITIRVRAEG